MTLDAEKAAARKTALAKRKAAHSAARSSMASALLVAHIERIGPRNVAGYLPIRSEINPLPAMEMLVRHIPVCVPVIDAPGRPLKFREWWPESVMESGPHGILQPAEGAFVTPELAIVPLVAFDDQLMRLGYGGGYYDRTLPRLRAASGKFQAIGLAYGAQQLDRVPTDPHDQRLDAVVTEKTVLTQPA
ncbi:5-formyltetrahydrofolate cyclo-ligase [Aliiroseovarius sp. PTFE2010]|uniref:5-formyltetrahydrofolate cyclo-ligase n=1 Tax=Aliiroseovarius sp. PTFE2010 TaxID=3417190 RepID=UPI003CF4239A